MTGAVLCGGASSRMGRPKHSLLLAGGETLLQRVAGVLAEVCDEVVVVGARPAGDWRCIDDERPSQGPLAGIEALLAGGIDDDYLVCPCDMPALTPEPLRALLASTSAPATVLRLEGETETRPLPVRVSADALPSIRAQLDAGRRAVHRWLETVDVHVVDAPAGWARLLRDVDTPMEYDMLKRQEED